MTVPSRSATASPIGRTMWDDDNLDEDDWLDQSIWNDLSHSNGTGEITPPGQVDFQASQSSSRSFLILPGPLPALSANDNPGAANPTDNQLKEYSNVGLCCDPDVLKAEEIEVEVTISSFPGHGAVQQYGMSSVSNETVASGGNTGDPIPDPLSFQPEDLS